MTHAATHDETRTEIFLFAFAAVLVLVTAAVTLTWGLAGLTVVALIATAVVFAMLMAYAAGL